MKGKYITTLRNEQVPADLRALESFPDVFPTNDGGKVNVIVEHSTEFNDDGEFLVYEELTKDLSEQNQSTLAIGPIFVGGDTTDMETFIEAVWKQPVTDDNIRQIVAEFKRWYAEIAPGEYHSPVNPLEPIAPWNVPFP